MSARIAQPDWPALLRLLDQALDVAAAERAAWLAQQQLPAPTRLALARLLEQRQVLEHEDFLATLPTLGLQQVDAATAASPFAAGALVGPWRLLRRLGEGGMSVVWLATRADGAVDREVALKLPHAGPGQDMLARRMLRERRILAALEHPHIARLYDVGFSEIGTPYLVMEYVSGQTLLTYADERKLGLGARVALFQQVLAAVQHAHARLVLHRDLKPSNVLVNSAGQVKLLDFGIATMLTEDGVRPPYTDITRAAGRPFTPGYASPEQLQGLPLSTASDVYSLGVVLYELLCGSKPCDRPTAPRAALLPASLHDDPTAPSQRTLSAAEAAARNCQPAALARALRGDLDLIVLEALAEEPARRYATADAFSADLSRWQNGQPIAARAPSAWYLAAKFVRRHALAVTLGAAGACTLLVAGGVAATQALAAHRQAENAASARDFLLELFGESAPDHMGGARLNAAELLQRGNLKAGQSLAHQPRLQAELLVGIARAQFQSNDMAGAEAALGRAADLFHALGDRRSEASARLQRVEVVAKDHRFGDLEHLMAQLQPLLPDIRANRLLHLRWMLAAGLVEVMLDPNVSPALLRRCAELADPQDPQQAKVAFEAQLRLARAYSARNRPADAARAFEAAEQTRLGDAPSEMAERSVSIAYARSEAEQSTNQYGAMMRWLPHAIDACERDFGAGSRRCGELQQRRLWALLRTGQIEQALARADELKPMMEQSAARYARFSSAYLLVNIAAASGKPERLQAAVVTLEQMLHPDAVDPLPAEHQVPGLYALALLKLRMGGVEAAEALIARADVVMAAHGPSKLKAEGAALDVARALAQQARGRDAVALKTLGTRCEVGGESSLGRSMQSLNCVRSLLVTGQRERAAALVWQAALQMSGDLGADAPNTLRAERLLAELEGPRTPRQPGVRAWNGQQIFVSGVR